MGNSACLTVNNIGKLTADRANDIVIPAQEYGFATLQRAQALGDFHSLNNKERRVILVHLGKNLEHGLKAVNEGLE